MAAPSGRRSGADWRPKPAHADRHGRGPMQAVMRAVIFLGTVCCLGEPGAQGALSATRLDDGRTVVSADHFRLTVDSRRGGEVTDIRLFDGAQWNRVLGADGQTCPAL